MYIDVRELAKLKKDVSAFVGDALKKAAPTITSR
jgi:hypothetical protein